MVCQTTISAQIKLWASIFQNGILDGVEIECRCGAFCQNLSMFTILDSKFGEMHCSARSGVLFKIGVSLAPMQ